MLSAKNARNYLAVWTRSKRISVSKTERSVACVMLSDCSPPRGMTSLSGGITTGRMSTHHQNHASTSNNPKHPKPSPHGGGYFYALERNAMSDLDPLEAIDQEEYDDPNPEEVTDPNHPDYVAPAKGIKSVGGGK